MLSVALFVLTLVSLSLSVVAIGVGMSIARDMQKLSDVVEERHKQTHDDYDKAFLAYASLKDQVVTFTDQVIAYTTQLEAASRRAHDNALVTALASIPSRQLPNA